MIPINKQYFINFFEKSFEDLPSRKILDFGCGNGDIILFAYYRGYDFYGIENYYSNADFEAQKQAVDVNVRDKIFSFDEIGNIPFPNSFFDFIYSNQVLEHVADLDHAMKEIFRVLKPNGVVLNIFPTQERLIEPHVRIPLFHKTNIIWLRRLLYYIWGNSMLTFESQNEFVNQKCFYRYQKDIKIVLTKYFLIEHYEKDKILFNLQHKSTILINFIKLIIRNLPSVFISKIEKYRNDCVILLKKQ
jgi:SAM-dependent methyltransferase